MNFEKLAQCVAESFFCMMKEEGLNTFKEMRQFYLWEAEDIREEICYSVKEAGGDFYDDMSVITIGWNEMAYGAFKKMVMAHLK